MAPDEIGRLSCRGSRHVPRLVGGLAALGLASCSLAGGRGISGYGPIITTRGVWFTMMFSLLLYVATLAKGQELVAVSAS